MFECPKCKGTTKVVQTVHGEEGGCHLVQRRCKCQNCGVMFVTKEVFDRYTEHTLRQHVKKVAGESNLQLFVKQLQTMRPQVSRKDGLVSIIGQSRPMTAEDWEVLSNMFKDIDTSDVGIIYPDGGTNK